MTQKSNWQTALPLNELEPGRMHTHKQAGCQLALGRTEAGEVFALDNRCPHEGYPLAQGTLRGNALSCCWHNWKFDVRDGVCTLGGEDVRTFPMRVREGMVELDLSEPDPTTFFPAWKASFEAGLFEHDNGRTIRDGVRLLQGGYDPFVLLADIVAYDGRHAQYGTTHTLAVAADCARFIKQGAGVEAMYAIAPAIDLCGDANRRLPTRELPEAIPYAGPQTRELLREAVENEDVERSLALLRGAFDGGVQHTIIQDWMYAILSDHFLDFGHELIYMIKSQDLLERVPESYAHDFYTGLLFRTLLGTREDTLPYMRGYAERLAENRDAFPALHAACSMSTPFARGDFLRVRDAVLDGSREAAFDAVLNALQAQVHPRRIAEALVASAAIRFFRFDVGLDSNPDVAENWLWVTHRFTFASAVREATERFDSPDVLAFLFQAVMFVHSGKDMDLPAERLCSSEPLSLTPTEVLDAIAARQTEAAVRGAAALLQDPAGLAELEVHIETLVLRDPLVRPIVVAHAIKSSVAAFNEVRALGGSPDRAWPLLAVVRFLASPLVERRVHEAVGTSIRWVAEGIMPRKLTQ